MTCFLIALIICVLVHLSAIASAGAMLGVSIQRFSFGFGPRLCDFGKLRIGLIPSGGAVEFLDTCTQDVAASERHRAFDQQPLLNKLVICASGCLAVAGVSLMLSGPVAWAEMVSTPYQFFAGALSPFGTAQELIRRGAAFAQQSSFLALLSVVAAKHCTLNALPFPALNGGYAMAAIGQHAGLARWWPRQATLLFMLVFSAAILSWGIAIISYVLPTGL